MFNRQDFGECDPFSPVLPAISPIKLFEQFNAISDLDPDELEPGDVEFLYIERPPIRIFFHKLFEYTLAQVKFASMGQRHKFKEYFNHTVNQSITLYLFWYTHVGLFDSEYLLSKFHDSGYITRLKKKFSDYFFFRVSKEDRQWYFSKYHIVVSFAIIRTYRSHFRGENNKNSEKYKEREKMRNSPKFVQRRRINIFGSRFEMGIYQLISEIITGVRMKTSHIVKAINRTFYSRRRIFETNFYCGESRMLQEQRIQKIEQKKKSRSVVSELERKMKTLNVNFEHPLKRTTALRGGLTHQTIANLRKSRMLKRRSTISNLNHPSLIKRVSSNTSLSSSASSNASSANSTPSSRPPSGHKKKLLRKSNYLKNLRKSPTLKNMTSKRKKRKRKKRMNNANSFENVRSLSRIKSVQEIQKEQDELIEKRKNLGHRRFDHLSKIRTPEPKSKKLEESAEKKKNKKKKKKKMKRIGSKRKGFNESSGRLRNISTHFLLNAKKKEEEYQLRQQKITRQRLVKVLTEEMSENEYFKYNNHVRESLRIMFMNNSMTTSGKQTRNRTLWCNYSLSPLINQTIPQPVNKDIIFFRNDRKYIEPYYHSSSALPLNKFKRQMKEHKKRWIETTSYDKFQESLVRQVAIQSVHEKIKKTYEKRIDWIVKEELEINEEFEDYNKMKQSCVNIFDRYKDLKNLKAHKVLNIDEIRTLSNRLSKRLTEYKRDMYDNIREERLKQKIRMKMNAKENRLKTQGFVNTANLHSFRN